MEINSALMIGFFFGTHMFLFCIAAYYVNNIFFKNDISVVSMFFFIKKPLYSYRLKNGIKIKFGYIPIGSFISYKSQEESFESEKEIEEKYNVKRTKILNLIILALIILTLFPITYIFGYNPFKIFEDVLSVEYRLITKQLNYRSLSPVINELYGFYGKAFFLFFFVMVQMIISSVLMFVFSLWEYLGLISIVMLIFAYFRYDLNYFMFPFLSYIDGFLSFVASGFLYFLLLRFFIK